MSIRIDPAQLVAARKAAEAENVSFDERRREDPGFELPAAIYAAMATMLFGFLLVLAVGLSTPGLIIPMGINFAFLTAFFAVPMIFSKTGDSSRRAVGFAEFLDRGIQTATGHETGRGALTLTLLLPAVILGWAFVIVTIAAYA